MKPLKLSAVSLAIGIAFCLQTAVPSLQPISAAQAQAQSDQSSAPLTSAQLQSLVSSIALYPDSLLSQMLMASTYPMEVAEAYNWYQSEKGKSSTQIQNDLKNETWDNSVKSLISFPQALELMGTKLAWTQQLGDAYLAQPKQVMDAVQTLRKRAQSSGNLKSSQQVTVSTQQSDIIIQPANPQVIYVPQYNPTVVYGAWPYPAYPPAPVYNPGWGLLSFGVGMAVGAALWSTPHWGSGSITVNNNTYNNFNRNYNSDINRSAERFGSSNSDWKFNAAHRGNVPFNNSELNRRYGDIGNRDAIARSQAQRYQSRDDNWKRNASPERQASRDETRQRAQSDFHRGGFGGDRAGADRFGGDRSGGSHFGGGHFGGGFRR